jgi:hypothetical protein
MAKKKEAAASGGQPKPQPKAGAGTPAKKAEQPAAKAGSSAAARKSAGRKSPQAGSIGTPLIDTSLAAAAAAKMVANRDRVSGGENRGGSGLIKQLKDTLNKPATTGPADFLHTTSPTKNPNLPFGGRNQVGHNQTFGADVNRAGVPRRTGG